MNSTLQKIQKIFRVFQILAKLAKVFAIVCSAICLVGALFALTKNNGGHVFGILGENLQLFKEDVDLKYLFCVFITDAILYGAKAILYGFAVNYFNVEQEQGTPFTQSGANLIQKLGVRCIYIPIVAIVVALCVTSAFGSGKFSPDTISNLPYVIVGIVLILTSAVFRYGSELEESCKVRTDNSGNI